jgi:hypothetical protein
LERTAQGAKTLKQDLAPDSEAHNIEGSLHPEFLIEHTRCRDLSAAVDRCHQRAALVVCPKLESSRGGSEPVKDLRRLLDLLEGSCPPGNPAEPGRPSCLPLKAHALLVAGPADLGMMTQAEPAMPERFLWLAGGSGPRLGHGSASNASEDSSAAPAKAKAQAPSGGGSEGGIGTLMEALKDALVTILATRRDGAPPAIGFETGGGASNDFDQRMREHDTWCDALEMDPGRLARELPSMLFWGLRFLVGSLPEKGQPSSEQILEASFQAAERLVKTHARELGVFRNADRIQKQTALAVRIMMEVLKAEAPLSMRDLQRSFSNQRKDRFKPVLDALIGLKVLAQEGKECYVPGDVDFNDAREELAGWLAKAKPDSDSDSAARPAKKKTSKKKTSQRKASKRKAKPARRESDGPGRSRRYFAGWTLAPCRNLMVLSR